MGGTVSWKDPLLFENTIHYGDKNYTLNCSTGEKTERETRNEDVIARARDKGYDDCSKGRNTVESRFYGWYFGGTFTSEKSVLFGKEVSTTDCYSGAVSKRMIWDGGQVFVALMVVLIMIVGAALYFLQPMTFYLTDGSHITARRFEVSKRGRYYRVGGTDINEDHVVRIEYGPLLPQS